jgi:hypothetical protein
MFSALVSSRALLDLALRGARGPSRTSRTTSAGSTGPFRRITPRRGMVGSTVLAVGPVIGKYMSMTPASLSRRRTCQRAGTRPGVVACSPTHTSSSRWFSALSIGVDREGPPDVRVGFRLPLEVGDDVLGECEAKDAHLLPMTSDADGADVVRVRDLGQRRGGRGAVVLRDRSACRRSTREVHDEAAGGADDVHAEMRFMPNVSGVIVSPFGFVYDVTFRSRTAAQSPDRS